MVNNLVFHQVSENEIIKIEKLIELLSHASTVSECNDILLKSCDLCNFLKTHPVIQELLPLLSEDEIFAILSIININQQHIFTNKNKTALEDTINYLVEFENNHKDLNGIIGYHLKFLKCLHNQGSEIDKTNTFKHPPLVDISKNSPEVRLAIRQAIDSLTILSEIYPVGGAGDRLNLINHNGLPLPVALLRFNGFSLLEGLIRDLQAKEYLYYKLHGSQIFIPIAMMTSQDKNNHMQILQECENNKWFGRSLSNFLFFIQPLVPVINSKGKWVCNDSLQLHLKPGGHGVIWKEALKQGVLKALMEKSRYALIRQINNPIASADYGLLAFCGWGISQKKKFGFASCPRLLNTSEGMDVLIEEKIKEGYSYRISNIEYVVFANHGLKDQPAKIGSPYSIYPTNTNILFVELQTIKDVIQECPYPGLLINMKGVIKQKNPESEKIEELATGRLECTMQNISDLIQDIYKEKLSSITPFQLSSFITYNKRNKTISVCKKNYTKESIQETPESCFYEMQKNNLELLNTQCKIKTPSLKPIEDYLIEGPSCIFIFHPALGPIYEIIGQKIQQGEFLNGAELQLEITEVEIKNLHLQGSCLITAIDPLGHKDKDGVIIYSPKNGKCSLKNVKINNKGINFSKSKNFWINQPIREESFSIILEGNAEFYAQDIEFNGDFFIKVPDQHRMTAYIEKGKLDFKIEKLTTQTWNWEYEYDIENKIRLKKILF